MNDSSGITEIIFFACVAIFLGLRLRSHLGRRQDDEDVRPPPVDDNIRPFPKPAASPLIEAYHRPAVDSVAGVLVRIRSFDPGFDAAVFLEGAKMAFRMIVEAYAQANEAALRPLLDDVVYQQFVEAIAVRRQAHETNSSELQEVVSGEIVDGALEGPVARLTVRFVSRQLIVIKNAAGAVIEGDPDHPVQLTDHWSFSRDLRSTSPNWLLVATHSGEE